MKPSISGTDLGISIAALVLSLMIGAGGALMGFFLLAFLDHCPPETCSVDGAVNAVGAAVVTVAAVLLAGAAVTVAQLVRRKPAWPFAVSTLALCVVAIGLGGYGYAAAVGG